LQRDFARKLFAGEESLRVHRDTTLSALAAALEATHPVCVRLVGPEFFRALARRFALDVPSRSPDLNDYGAELAEYLAGFEPARGLEYLPDVARLEWALHRARCAADPPPLDLARVTARLSFRLAPGTALLASLFPVDRIWLANQPEADGESQVDLGQGGAELVVAREPLGARFTRVTPEELELLRGVARGLPLEDAAASWPGSAESLGAALALATERRWLY
jgi:hypothetical protein